MIKLFISTIFYTHIQDFVPEKICHFWQKLGHLWRFRIIAYSPIGKVCDIGKLGGPEP